MSMYIEFLYIENVSFCHQNKYVCNKTTKIGIKLLPKFPWTIHYALYKCSIQEVVLKVIVP